MPEKKSKSRYSLYILLCLLAVLAYLAYMIIRPFIVTLMISAVLVYAFHPIHRRLRKWIRSDFASALILTVFIILCVAIPLFLAVNALGNDVVNYYSQFRLHVAEGNLFGVNCSPEEGFCRLKIGLNNFAAGLQFEPYIDFKALLGDSVNYIIGMAKNFIFSLPAKIFEAILLVIATYYFFKDGERIVNFIVSSLSIEKKYEEQIKKKIDNVLYGLVYGNIVAAVVEGVVAVAGFHIFGVKAPFFWGFAIFVLALVPAIGGSLVWIPIAIVKILSGDVFNGVGIAIYCFVLISCVDIFVKPKVIGIRANLHPMAIILGIAGGIVMFGIAGIIFGPIILALLLAFTDIYKQEIKSSFAARGA